MNKKQKRIFEILKIAAIANECGTSKHAAAVVYKGDIIGFGFNQLKSHPFQRKFAKNNHAIFLHAEVMAIYNALKKVDVETLKKCEIFVVRVLKNGEIANSKPCDGCMRAIETFNLKKVHYSYSQENLLISS